MSLTVALITRNHARTLARALASVAEVATDLLVLDTGSTDGTLEVAAACGARVGTIPWDDDFAAACNVALREAHGNWFFLMNPDEELLRIDPVTILALLANDGVFGYTVRIQELVTESQPPPYVEGLSPRLFRRQGDISYLGRMHPHFAVPLDQVAAIQGRRVVSSDLILRHHAYLSTATPDKLRWALRLIERELEDRPGQLHYEIERGLHALYLGDSQSHVWLGAVAGRLWQAREEAQSPDPAAARVLEYLLTTAPEVLQAPIGRAEAAILVQRWYSRAPVLLWRLAEIAFQQKDHARAAWVLEQLVELGKTGEYDRSLAFDPGLLGPSTLLNLASCRIQLGQLDLAEAVLRLVPPGSPQQARAQEQRQLIAKLRAGTPGF